MIDNITGGTLSNDRQINTTKTKLSDVWFGLFSSKTVFILTYLFVMTCYKKVYMQVLYVYVYVNYRSRICCCCFLFF